MPVCVRLQDQLSLFIHANWHKPCNFTVSTPLSPNDVLNYVLDNIRRRSQITIGNPRAKPEGSIRDGCDRVASIAGFSIGSYILRNFFSRYIEHLTMFFFPLFSMPDAKALSYRGSRESNQLIVGIPRIE